MRCGTGTKRTTMRLLLATLLPLIVSSFAPKAGFTPFRPQTTQRFAADGAPRYDKMDGRISEAEWVGDGSVMLRVEVATGDDVTLDYEPGHVLALELEDPNGIGGQNSEENGGWMRAPYTVTRSTDRSFDVLIKTVGPKSRAFAAAAGAPVKFGGKFKVPILDGISKDEVVKRIVMIATGVGVGPCIGAIERALEDEDGRFPRIELYASARTREEILYVDHLDALAETNPEKFGWTSVVTSETGRVSSGDNLNAVAANGSDLEDTHYHLIGNGRMVNEWKLGLEKAGVPNDKVTTEMYFNHKAEVNARVVESIAASISSRCTAQV